MYKLLLCVRYLRTRYLAFVCIVSVMLGVATLIVVNSVMSGFSNKLKDRLHGILADTLVETDRPDGFEEPPDAMTARIKASPAGQYVADVSPTVEVFALLQYHVRDRHGRLIPITKHVRVVGVDPAKHAKVGRFSEYLVRQKNAPAPSFDMTAEGRDRSAWNRLMAGVGEPTMVTNPLLFDPPARPREARPGDFLDGPKVVAPPAGPVLLPPPVVPDAPPARTPGGILGYSLVHHRYTDPDGTVSEVQLLKEGDEFLLATVGADGLKPRWMTFAVADFFKSEMSEYDGSFVYVPLDELQRMRGMDNRVNTLQVRLTDDVRDDPTAVHKVVIPTLQKEFAPEEAQVRSWQQHQGPLLAAIDIERGILNLLLFMIVGVAGFSVLSIFSMIVSEKYRDIGVMKSLGASDRGVMGIFLGYGILLGLIGCGLGTVAGLLITEYINEIEAGLTEVTGQQVFDRSVYYFDRIPTNVETGSVLLINLGALLTAGLFSLLPAWRAARLQPVRALRFE